jgi:multidrug efflux pump subunit AcrA (membrane-fusion protein)
MKGSIMKRKKVLIVLVLLAVAMCVLGFTISKPSSNALEGSGTVEARNIRVGSKVGGRINEVRVREGENVKAGQVLVLDRKTPVARGTKWSILLFHKISSPLIRLQR